MPKAKIKKKEAYERITITYEGKLDTELDSRLAGLLEFPPFNFSWIGQGYDLNKRVRDISFERKRN